MVAGSVLWRTALSRKEYQVLLVRVSVPVVVLWQAVQLVMFWSVVPPVSGAGRVWVRGRFR